MEHKLVNNWSIIFVSFTSEQLCANHCHILLTGLKIDSCYFGMMQLLPVVMRILSGSEAKSPKFERFYDKKIYRDCWKKNRVIGLSSDVIHYWLTTTARSAGQSSC